MLNAIDTPSTATRMCIDFGTALSKVSVCIDPYLPLPVGVRPLAIGSVAGAEHPLLTPSVLFVEGGRLFFGPQALELARDGVDEERDALLSFKVVLGAEDIDRALMQRIPRTVDPTGTLRERDALVLYLAYLDQLILEALHRSETMPPGVAQAPRRFTSPVWRQGSAVENAMRRVFNEAAAVSAKLGRLFLAPEGISIAQCKHALDLAVTSPLDARLETGVFEPHAAAAAALAYSVSPVRFVLVFDMGAGTTDLAAFDFDESTEPPSLSEIREARWCSALAGDEVDRVLLNMLLARRGAAPQSVEDGRFLRAARLNARDMKRELFLTGKCGLREGWRTTGVRRDELFEDPGFRGFTRALSDAIQTSLAVVAHRARSAGAQTIDVVLAGGGAALPFLPDLVRQSAPPNLGPVQLRIEPLSPMSSLYAGIDDYFADVFPQIAMSIGGALVEMLPPE